MRVPPPLPGTAIIVGGQPHEVIGQRVITWHEHKKPVLPWRGYNKPRRRPIDLIVVHWTGGENPPLVVADVLARRKLGSEFIVGVDGTIYQFCDPKLVDTADAGPVNARSVGIEVVNYGIRRLGKRPDGTGKLPTLWTVPKAGKGRSTHVETINGRKAAVADFYPAQVFAVAALGRALHRALGIPLQPPRDEQGEVLARALTPGELAAHRGVVGHFHVDRGKLDPGVVMIRRLDAEWNA